MYKLMKRIYLLLSLLLCSLLCMSQVSTSQNYISTRTYTSPDHSGCREQVVYFDGLGRPSQTVDCGITPDGKDLVSLQEYDDQGRKLRTWLPAKSAGNGNYMTLSSLQSGASSLAGGDARPYLQTTYEASPLNRPVAQHGAGETWAEHPVSYQYITRNPRSFPSSYYMTPSGNFLGVCTTDEDGNQAYEFKDGFGRTILAGRMDGSDPCFAYYEYDNHDDLVNVYPPFVTYYQMNEPEGPYATQSSYSYHYDFLHRCVYKKLPERDAIYYIYDHGDHQVLSQDGEQRVRGEWAFSLSDELNRPVLTGICHNSYYYDDFPLCETDTYNRQSNLTSLRRNGRTGASSYGLIDDLTLTLDGNWLTRVDDAATASAYNDGFEFKDAVKQDNEYTYDKNGNMTKDLNKNITDIQYNCLNSPSKVTFQDGSTITYTYAVNGTKLRTVHTIGNTTSTTDYCGNVIYENGVQKLLLTDAGHVTLSDKKYHYYLQDHQGNNRVVVDQTGQKEEVNHYYPFGGTFASADNSIQPYKYNGKELDTKNGLNWYDYGARQYDVAIGRWNAVDPMAEKYYWISPYTYCAGNPLKYIDLKGDSISVADLYAKDKQGELINPNQVEVFEFLMNTKEGKALLGNYAAKGQTIAGVSFNKDGEFHRQGINISFGTGVRDRSVSGTTTFSLDDKNLNIQVLVGNSSDKSDLLDTFVHEIAIHADQNSVDFSDDRKMNNSNAYPALRKMNGSRGYTQHWQERNVNRAMERVGVPIIQQYYKSNGVLKPKSAILKSVYGFIN